MPDDFVRCHCSQCGHDTKHDVVATRDQHGSDDLGEGIVISWDTTYDVLECRGCETVTLRKRFWFSEWDHDACEVTFYPPPISRRLPTWRHSLPKEMASLLEETYTALHAGSTRLAMMGARALVDMMMTRAVGDRGGFERKLKLLEEEGYLSSRSREVLEAALEVGHATAHRGHTPSSAEAEQVLDIVENTLQARQLGEAARALSATTSRRGPPPPTADTT